MKVQSLKLGEAITKMCIHVATELSSLPDEDDDDISPARSALGLLDMLSESLPPSQVAVPLLKSIGPYVQSEDPQYRRAGKRVPANLTSLIRLKKRAVFYRPAKTIEGRFVSRRG